MNEYSEKGLLPAGLADMLPPSAVQEADVSARLISSFASYGYQQVKPPLIEFEEHLLEGAGEALSSQMFRVMDPVSHRMMGVRTDITLQAARIATTRLRGDARPLRLSYSGQVLRVHGTQLRPERQFTQSGIELIGSDDVSADAEIILLAAEALADLNVENVSVDLTLPTLVPDICQELGTEQSVAEQARLALDQKDAAVLAEFEPELSEILIALLRAAGPARDALSALQALSLPKKAARQIKALTQLVSQVEAAAPQLSLTIDPGEFRGFEYQTGLSFTLFARNVRGELGRGGRYHLINGEPATGFTLFLDSIMRALPSRQETPLLYIPFDTSYEAAVELRRQGWRTLKGLRSEEDPQAEAVRQGCSHILKSGGPEKIA